MPSVIIGNPFLSGPMPVISGNPWSGTKQPITGIQFVLDRSASGSVYLGLSGGITYNSGAMFLSGGSWSGMLDGIQVAPSASYFIPRMAFQTSGTFNVYAWHDAACSGQARLFFECY